jgi:predicted nucleotidyltransferase
MRWFAAPDETTVERVCWALADALASNPQVAFAYLYGSFAERLPFRDIDVGVYLAQGATRDPDEELAMADALSRLLALPVDVRIVNGAPPTFLVQVLRGVRLVCRDEELLADVTEQTMRQYFDIEPVLRWATREVVGP